MENLPEQQRPSSSDSRRMGREAEGAEEAFLLAWLGPEGSAQAVETLQAAKAHSSYDRWGGKGLGFAPASSED